MVILRTCDIVRFPTSWIMSNYHVGDRVEINKDLFRYENLWPKGTASFKRSKISQRFRNTHAHLGASSKVKYASKGERGIIVQIFRATVAGYDPKPPVFAKMKMDNGLIKTTRLTSLKRLA